MNYRLIIFEIIGCSCAGIIISHFVNFNIKKWIYQYKKKSGQNLSKPIKLKPFDCETCLSFWLGLTIFIFQKEYLMAFFYASISSILSQIIYRKINE